MMLSVCASDGTANIIVLRCSENQPFRTVNGFSEDSTTAFLVSLKNTLGMSWSNNVRLVNDKSPGVSSRSVDFVSESV